MINKNKNLPPQNLLCLRIWNLVCI